MATGQNIFPSPAGHCWRLSCHLSMATVTYCTDHNFKIIIFSITVCQMTNMCMCVCVCVCVLGEWGWGAGIRTQAEIMHFYAPWSTSDAHFHCKTYWMFYMTNEPEDKWMYTNRHWSCTDLYNKTERSNVVSEVNFLMQCQMTVF